MTQRLLQKPVRIEVCEDAKGFMEKGKDPLE